MKHLKRFNESVIEDSIMNLCNDHLAYLKDAGFHFNFQEIEKFYTWTNVINISKSSFYWEDIKYDLLPFVEVLMENYTVGSIKIFTFNNNDRVTQHTYIYSRFKVNNYNIKDFLNEEGIPNDKLLIAIEILFT